MFTLFPYIGELTCGGFIASTNGYSKKQENTVSHLIDLYGLFL